MNTTFGAALRSDFLIRPDITFLNNGSFGATPRVVLETQHQWQEGMERQPVEFVLRTLPTALRDAVSRMATFMNADAEDVVFVENASTGVSSVIHSLLPVLKPGDELLTTSHVYNAVRQTMKHVCGLAQAIYVEVDVPFPTESPAQIRDILKSAMNEKTVFVLIDHITSPTGLLFPVEEIVSDCHERGISVMIDGAHAPGMIDLDLKKIDADWYTGNFHKWLFAPKGCAFLYTRQEKQQMTHPLVLSHGYLQGYITEFDYLGTKDWSAYLSAPQGLEYFENLGAQAVREHNNHLARVARRYMIEALPQAEPCPESMLTCLASVLLPLQSDEPWIKGMEIHDRLWDEFGIEVPVFGFGKNLILRIAAHVFNEESQYAYLAECLRKMFPHA